MPDIVGEPPPYVVILSGTHVTGKETIAISLAASLNCPWLRAENITSSTLRAARSYASRSGGNGFEEKYGRVWFTQMQRIGLMSNVSLEPGGLKFKKTGLVHDSSENTGCLAFITMYALRKPMRDAIREVMGEQGVRVIFVVLQITEETLSGRTLGAEEPELNEKIMAEKTEDIRVPLEEERDVLVVDSMRDVDSCTLVIEDLVMRQVVVR